MLGVPGGAYANQSSPVMTFSASDGIETRKLMEAQQVPV